MRMGTMLGTGASLGTRALKFSTWSAPKVLVDTWADVVGWRGTHWMRGCRVTRAVCGERAEGGAAARVTRGGVAENRNG
jgi:hypothetical protein